MQKIHFSVLIKASKVKVWKTMLEDTTYRQWTAAFNPGSYYKGSWTEGSKMLFLGPDPKTGKEGGMVSFIRKVKPNEFISIEHVGLIENGVEDTTSEKVKQWTPAFENYTLTEKDGQTEVVVDMDIADEFKAMFEDMWPKALQLLKSIAEK